MSFLVTVQVRDNMTRILFAELYVTKLEIDKHVPTSHHIDILTCFEMAGLGRCSMLFGQI